MTVTTVVAALQTINAAVTGITNAPTDVPGNLTTADLPTVITWPTAAESGWESGANSQRVYTITVYVMAAEQGLGVSEGWTDAQTYLQRLVAAYLLPANVILVADGTYNASIRNGLDDSPIVDSGVDMFAYPPPATGVSGWPHYFGCQFQVTVKEIW